MHVSVEQIRVFQFHHFRGELFLFGTVKMALVIDCRVCVVEAVSSGQPPDQFEHGGTCAFRHAIVNQRPCRVG